MKRIFRNAEDGEADSHWNLKERGGSFAPPLSLAIYIYHSNALDNTTSTPLDFRAYE
jgi:hypothetical protein